MALVGELMLPMAVFAVCCLSRFMLAFICASLAALSLYFLTPSQMCPMSTCRTSGSLSRTLQRLLVDALIFTRLARLSTFSTKTMCIDVLSVLLCFP